MSPRQCGLFIVPVIDKRPGLRAPLKSINVFATTCGPIAHNVIKFNYRNNNCTAIQSKFIFPVNSQSCIYHLSAVVGGRSIVGKVKEKEAAKTDYDKAVASGTSAVLAKESKEASDIIELELGAFGVDEEAEVTIKEVFEMKLQTNGGQFQYKFPTRLFVRYGDTITASASQNGPTEYFLDFKLHSYGGVNKITSKKWLGSEMFEGMFSFQGNREVFQKDHDVVLDLTLESDFAGVKMTEKWKDLSKVNPKQQKTDKMIMLSSFLVRVPKTPIAELPAKEYVFVVDCSGSMDGDRIESAGKTLQLLINSLPVGSFFNIFRFGSRYESLFSTTKEYTRENKDIAIKLAETLAADLGGTELYDCLKSVVQCKKQICDYKRQVFVLTDGGISNQEATLELVKKHSKDNRFFSFGIGSGCSTSLVNGLADAGLGSASFIGDKESFEWEKQENLSSTCIKSLMASASQHISKIEISPLPKAPKECISLVVDSMCLNVFHGGGPKDQPRNPFLCCRTSMRTPQDITLQLTQVNNREEHVITKQSMCDIEIMESPFEPNVLHKLKAKKVISEMVTAKLANPYQSFELKQKIINLSVREQVLSPYTALVGVADKKRVVGVSQRVDVGSDADFLCVPEACVLRSPPRVCKASKPDLCKDLSWSRSLDQEIIGAAYSPPPLQPRNMYFGGTASDDDDDMMMDDLCSLPPTSLPMMGAPSTPPPPIPSSKTNVDSKLALTYQTITNQQNPGGEWLDKLPSEPDDTLFKSIETVSKDRVIQCTMYAILLLVVEFSDTFDEWKLAAIKGITILKKSIPELHEQILKILAVSNVEVDEDILYELLE